MRDSVRLLGRQVAACCAFSLGLMTLGAQAALEDPPDNPPPTATTAYFEQGLLIRSGEVIQALGPNLMGDSVNEYSGGLEFTQTDVSLPGNNALPVAVGRHKAVGTIQAYSRSGLFANWDLDIPHLHTIATQKEPNWYGAGSSSNFNRCSQFAAPPFTIADEPAVYPRLTIMPDSFWEGYHMYVPGSGDQTLLGRYSGNAIYPGDGSATQYPVVTNKHWQISCLPAIDNGPGEGFEARSPDGVRYRFDHMAIRPWGNLTRPGYVPRVEIWMLPTLVTDRFGNWVRYTYGSADGWQVSSITSSDGRQITFTYNGNGNRIASISDGTRTWTYGYSSTGTLQTVTQPDSSSWTFAIDSLTKAPYPAGDPGCDTESDWNTKPPASGTITHPSGAVGTFVLTLQLHGRSGIPGRACHHYNKVGLYFAAWSLTSKTLSGPGMPAMTWSYAYTPGAASYAPCNGCANTKTVTITDPLNNVTVNTYGTQYGLQEGLLLSSNEGSGLRVTNYAYRGPDAGPYPRWAGGTGVPSDSMSGIFTPQSQRTTTQQGVTFWQTVNAFDVYARPTSVTKSNSLGYSKDVSTSYYDAAGLWVLGQLKARTVAGVLASRTEYDDSTALPKEMYRFEKLQARYAFNGDGTLASMTDGLNHTTRFNNYMRGLPQSVGYADGTGISGVVNNIGELTSVTNEANTTSTFTYDAMGRLASKTPPSGDAVAYNPTTLSFVQVGTPEYGLDANHWRQTIQTGNAVTVNYFDARWRKRVTVTYDAANPGATQRMQRFDYDPYNRTTFSAYPARSIASIGDSVPGATTSYDALGRPTQTLADSELGTLTATTEYLDGFQKRVTDARGYKTTTGFQVFDAPSEDAIAWVAAPEGLNVSISRDVFGKPLSITRSGSYGGASVSATRSYVYDGNHLLCKTIEPEIGATIQQLDAANNVAWRATGLGLTGPNTCDWSSVPGERMVAYAYDARNRVTGTGFGDGSPAIGRSYTDDGLPFTVSSGDASWVYRYNNRRLLTSETLSYGGSNYIIGRAYDVNGHLGQLTYPGGSLVDYSPNALGEPTQASGYASGV
ncbi:MAG TPA: hypothetical protein VJO99_17690, partial [Burkholderiaceae bacterium]|nr:hypothetical protein [Burkholderiaceae bacterium]